MNSRPPTLMWLNHFFDDEKFGAIRFKCLDKGYPRFDFDDKLIDIVSDFDFSKIENNRIPLFIGSQFGINPRINEISDFFNGDKIIAVLGKSLLSGCVAGLSIYRINRIDVDFNAEESKKIIFFENKE